MRLRRRHNDIPTLATAALPDLIFTVLFFFMIVTHLRKNDVHVKYVVPQGTQLTAAEHKDNAVYVYVGKHTGDNSSAIQVNDKPISRRELSSTLANEISVAAQQAYGQPVTVILSADRETDMGTIAEIKYHLKRNGVQKIHYTALETEK